MPTTSTTSHCTLVPASESVLRLVSKVSHDLASPWFAMASAEVQEMEVEVVGRRRAGDGIRWEREGN